MDVALTTYKITLSTASAKAGEVVFHVHNDAVDQVHEFVVFKTDLPEDQLPLTSEGIVDEEGAGITFIDEVEDVTAIVDDHTAARKFWIRIPPGRHVDGGAEAHLEPDWFSERAGSDHVPHLTHGQHVTKLAGDDEDAVPA